MPTGNGMSAGAMPSDGAMPSGDAMDAGADAMKSGAGDMADGQMKGAEVGGAEEMMLPHGQIGAKAVAAGMGKDGLPVVTVSSTETACKANKKSVPAGQVWFKIMNKGMQLNELYLENTAAKELIQVEPIKAGQYGGFKMAVKKGKYLLACEPGGNGKQIRTPITVTAAAEMM
jgi:hypothetical protein